MLSTANPAVEAHAEPARCADAFHCGPCRLRAAQLGRASSRCTPTADRQTSRCAIYSQIDGPPSKKMPWRTIPDPLDAEAPHPPSRSYQVNELGQVRSITPGGVTRILQQQTNPRTRYQTVSLQRWVLDENGNYVRRSVTHDVHALVGRQWFPPAPGPPAPHQWVDHIDHQRDNPALDNLQPATPSQNRYRGNTRNVTPVQTKRFGTRYRARITRNGITTTIGSFPTEERAIEEYQLAAAAYDAAQAGQDPPPG